MPNIQTRNNFERYLERKINEIEIFLDIPSYECLVEHIIREAPNRVAINAAVLLSNTRVVDCDDVEALDLLVKARSQCPSAVARIAEAMRAAGFILLIPHVPSGACCLHRL